MTSGETIAAVSTPLGAGGIAIIRISGPQALRAAERLFHPEKAGFPLKSHQMNLKDHPAGRRPDDRRSALLLHEKPGHVHP